MSATTAPPAYDRGFESLEEEIVVDRLPVTGTLPDWLAGSLLRTGPAKFEAAGTPLRHWFDGLAMLHRFTIADGAVAYGNRFLRGRSARAILDEGRIAYPEFATDPCRSVFQRVQSLFAPRFGDNANVNVAQLGERFIAMTEAPISVQFDPETLEAAGVPFMPPGMITTAHPHRDRATAGMLNYAAKLGARTEYRFFHLAPDADEPEVIARIPVREPGYVHSFGLTERWIVLAEFPWVVNPLALALAGRPFAENFRWKPGRGTRFLLVDRRTGALRDGPELRAEACFAFHHVNAYEDGDEVVVDLSVYPDPAIVEALYLDRLRAGDPIPEAELRRFRLHLSSGRVTQERLVDEPFELGRINYGRCNERPYRCAWGVSGGSTDWLDAIVKADVVERTAIRWHEPGCYPGEPVFVARPGADDEDDGVLLSVALDAGRGTSFLLVLDARDLSERARAEVPHHIPFSFHGQFARA
jgi:beta,beta-carotene 9',10'-dioxygenase